MYVRIMVEKGLNRIGKPLRDIDTAIENVGNLELFKLEKRLSTLASIAGAAPMIGFFGTVTGMMLAFYKMSSESNVTPDVLAGGIYQALYTTAGGLFIGILAFVGYNLLVASVDKVIFQMEKTAVDFMDLLQEPSPLTDIIFLLLIFFMLTSSAIQINVPLAESDSKTVAPTDIAVMITKDGVVKYNGRAVRLSQVEGMVKRDVNAQKTDKDATMTIIAEVDVPWEKVNQLMTIASKLRLRAIMATQPKE